MSLLKVHGVPLFLLPLLMPLFGSLLPPPLASFFHLLLLLPTSPLSSVPPPPPALRHHRPPSILRTSEPPVAVQLDSICWLLHQVAGGDLVACPTHIRASSIPPHALEQAPPDLYFSTTLSGVPPHPPRRFPSSTGSSLRTSTPAAAPRPPATAWTLISSFFAGNREGSLRAILQAQPHPPSSSPSSAPANSMTAKMDPCSGEAYAGDLLHVKQEAVPGAVCALPPRFLLDIGCCG